MVTNSAKREMRTTIRKIENLLTKVYEGKTVQENDLDTLLRYWEYEYAKIKQLIELRDSGQASIPLKEWFALTQRKVKEYRFQFED